MDMTKQTTKPPKNHVIIATRGSALALWQANYVTDLLKQHGVSAEKLIIKTTGDRVQDRFLHEIGGKGLFVREIEQALLDGKADLAIHSLKDMPAKLAPPFALPAILKRHASDDLLILRDDIKPELNLTPPAPAALLASLGKATIGTGSLRRSSIIKRVAPEIETVGIRGNVDTRIRKLQEGSWDGIILAHASIERLHIQGIRSVPLGMDWFIPSPSQGALAIECRAEDPLASWLAVLNHDVTSCCVDVERTVLARLGGDCTMPFACHVKVRSLSDSHEILGHAAVYGKDGQMAEAKVAKTTKREEGHGDLPARRAFSACADQLFLELINAGAKEVLAGLGLSIP